MSHIRIQFFQKDEVVIFSDQRATRGSLYLDCLFGHRGTALVAHEDRIISAISYKDWSRTPCFFLFFYPLHFSEYNLHQWASERSGARNTNVKSKPRQNHFTEMERERERNGERSRTNDFSGQDMPFRWLMKASLSEEEDDRAPENRRTA